MLLGRQSAAASSAAPKPVAGYRRVLVPIVDDEVSLAAVGLACRLAAARAKVTVVTVIELPAELPLDAHMFEEERAARQLLVRARALEDRFDVDIARRVLRAHDPAEAIVAEAERGAAEAIVIGALRRENRTRPRRPVFGETVRDVLKKARCRVLVVAGDENATTRRH